jgi:hypothetical protein
MSSKQRGWRGQKSSRKKISGPSNCDEMPQVVVSIDVVSIDSGVDTAEEAGFECPSPIRVPAGSSVVEKQGQAVELIQR